MVIILVWIFTVVTVCRLTLIKEMCFRVTRFISKLTVYYIFPATAKILTFLVFSTTGFFKYIFKSVKMFKTFFFNGSLFHNYIADGSRILC